MYISPSLDLDQIIQETLSTTPWQSNTTENGNGNHISLIFIDLLFITMKQYEILVEKMYFLGGETSILD